MASKLLTIKGPQTARLYLTEQNPAKATVFYVHGGGLIYGLKDDLPQEYINLFLSAGYNLCSVDYALAPESGLHDIIESINTAFEWFLDTLTSLSGTNRFILFGRSAGAYLCFQLLANHQLSSSMPLAFLDFYGFYDLTVKELRNPARYYQQFATVDDSTFPTGKKSPVYVGDIETRFPIYVSARQKGTWQEITQATSHNQKPIDPSLVPPTYIVHATSDTDVPFTIALKERALLNKSVLIPISSSQHDFDRSVTTKTLEVYQAAIMWLDTII